MGGMGGMGCCGGGTVNKSVDDVAVGVSVTVVSEVVTAGA